MSPTWLTIGIIGGALITMATLFSRNETGSGVGTNPGDVGKAANILAVARERGHDLALFGAG